MAKLNNTRRIHRKESIRMTSSLMYTSSVSRRQWHTPSVLGWGWGCIGREKERGRNKERKSWV